MSDEKRDIRYIQINKKDFTASFLPTENELLDYYNNNMDLYFENEKRSFIQFNFKTSINAEKFKKNISALNTYDEVIAFVKKHDIIGFRAKGGQ